MLKKIKKYFKRRKQAIKAGIPYKTWKNYKKKRIIKND